MLMLIPILACFGPTIPLFGPLFAFRVAVIVLFLATVFQRRNAPERSALRTVALLLVFVWLLVALLLLLFRGASDFAWAEGVSVFTGALFLLAIAAIRVPLQAQAALLVGWLIAYIGTSMVAVREIFFGIPFQNYYRLQSTNPILDGFGSASSLGNPNNYALFLVISYPILCLGAVGAKSRMLRVGYVMALCSLPVFMLATGSRIGFVTLVFVALLSAIVFLNTRRVVLALGLGFISALAFSEVVRSEFLSAIQPLALFFAGDSFWFRNVISNISDDNSAMIRVHLLQNGLDFSLETYLTGLGLGGFEARMLSGDAAYPTQGIINPHNGVIEILSQFGVAVFILFLCLLLALWANGWKAVAQNANDRSTRVAGLALVALVGIFPILSTMNSSFLEPSISWLFLAALLLIGLALKSPAIGLANDVPVDSSSNAHGGANHG
ncbi:hypothetical protein GY21_01460 [Cryobacterium roopkundense]|nr:hypothetical protein GY21_01460 [Cryobacterium roopkundense]